MIQYDPAIPFWAFAQEMKSSFPRDLHTAMFIAAVFTMAKKWKELCVYPLMSGVEAGGSSPQCTVLAILLTIHKNQL